MRDTLVDAFVGHSSDGGSSPPASTKQSKTKILSTESAVMNQFDLLEIPNDLAVNEITNRVYTGNGAQSSVIVVDIVPRQIRTTSTDSAIIIKRSR